MLKVALLLAIVFIFSSCASTKIDATYSRSDKETKTVKVESVISLLKVPITVCYILSDTEIPFRVDFPISLYRRPIMLSYEATYEIFRNEKIQAHMVSFHIPF
jgi:hypothetical protein